MLKPYFSLYISLSTHWFLMCKNKAKIITKAVEMFQKELLLFQNWFVFHFHILYTIIILNFFQSTANLIYSNLEQQQQQKLLRLYIHRLFQ